MNYKRTLITAALPYANGPVHIGHLAGVYIPADIYARYLRLKGQEVLYVCGSDEHGVPVTIRARKEGVTTQQVVDRYHELIKRSFADFGISFDIYSRTTSAITISWRRIISASYTITASSSSKLRNSSTIPKQGISLPTETSEANVRTATISALMVTSVRNVALPSHRKN